MFNKFRILQFQKYNKARDYLVEHPEVLIKLEEYFITFLHSILNTYLEEIINDYNEASFLFPFWQNYPPDDRGRKPRGDQYPWIEVGEHVFGGKLPRLLAHKFSLRDCGLPTGPDERFIVRHSDIVKITKGLTDQCWLFIDVKSVGPRDDHPHAVMSHNQISGDGIWNSVDAGVKNTVLEAVGKRTSHPFYCSIPPLYILSDGTILPVILVIIKPVYSMLNLNKNDSSGQPIKRITLVSIPNGLLLTVNPNYLGIYPTLLFPGKDDKSKNPLKVRCRISFEILREIAKWRVLEINC